MAPDAHRKHQRITCGGLMNTIEAEHEPAFGIRPFELFWIVSHRSSVYLLLCYLSFVLLEPSR